MNSIMDFLSNHTLLTIYVIVSLFMMGNIYNIGVDCLTENDSFKRWSERKTQNEKLNFIGIFIMCIVTAIILGALWPLVMTIVVLQQIFGTPDDDNDENNAAGSLSAS